MNTIPAVLALIPARGGSKSIPRKNLLVVGGKPLIAYSIEQALASRRITRTIVSTDDEEIADVARQYGAEVPFMRPAELATDAATDHGVFLHALEWLRQHEGYGCECIAHLRPTGPVRAVARIDEAIGQLLARPDVDTLRSVSWPTQSPFKMWRVHDGLLVPLVALAGYPDAASQPRQSLPEVFWQNGYIDVIRPHVVTEFGRMVGTRVLPFVVHEPILELDYPETIPLLEAALRAQRDGQWPPSSHVPLHPV